MSTAHRYRGTVTPSEVDRQMEGGDSLLSPGLQTGRALLLLAFGQLLRLLLRFRAVRLPLVPA